MLTMSRVDGGTEATSDNERKDLDRADAECHDGKDLEILFEPGHDDLLALRSVWHLWRRTQTRRIVRGPATAVKIFLDIIAHSDVDALPLSLRHIEMFQLLMMHKAVHSQSHLARNDDKKNDGIKVEETSALFAAGTAANQ